jgi:hypothetical protein
MTSIVTAQNAQRLYEAGMITYKELVEAVGEPSAEAIEMQTQELWAKYEAEDPDGTARKHWYPLRHRSAA